MTVLRYADLDAGIRPHVRALSEAGFRTTDSGDGVSKQGTVSEACMLPFPNVAIVLDDEDALVAEAERAQEVLDGIEAGWSVEASWSTADRVPVLFCARIESNVEGRR